MSSTKLRKFHERPATDLFIYEDAPSSQADYVSAARRRVSAGAAARRRVSAGATRSAAQITQVLDELGDEAAVYAVSAADAQGMNAALNLPEQVDVDWAGLIDDEDYE